MCGIAGIVGAGDWLGTVEAMTETLRHRDEDGVFRFRRELGKLEGGGACLALPAPAAMAERAFLPLRRMITPPTASQMAP